MKTKFRNFPYILKTEHKGVTKGQAKRILRNACKRYNLNFDRQEIKSTDGNESISIWYGSDTKRLVIVYYR